MAEHPDDTFDVAYLAQLSVERLSRGEQAELKRILGMADAARHADTAPGMPGHFITRLGDGKRVLWHRSKDGRPEIVSVVDRSYAAVP